MKIALNGMLLKHRLSGVEVAILSLANALAKHGSEYYSFYVPGNFPQSDAPTARFTTCRAPGCTRLRPLRILWEQCVIPRLATDAASDILHAPGYIAPLFTSIPVVITVYDMIALNAPELCRPANALNYRLMLPPSVRKAARIIVPSEATRSELLQTFPEAGEKTLVIHLGIDENLQPVVSPEQLAAFRAGYGLPDRFILFTGRQEPKKNLARLVEAFHMLRSGGKCLHKLVLAGTPDRDTPGIRRRISALGLDEEIILPGFVPIESLPSLYSAADLFVFPSLYEGFGLPPLEAMACGTPVVASNRTSLPEIVDDAALLADPTDPAAIANAVKQGIEDEALRARLIAAGHKRTRHFSWEKAAKSTEAVYRALLH